MSKPTITAAAKKAIFQRAHKTARSLSLTVGAYARRFKIALRSAWAKFSRQDFEFRAFWTAERTTNMQAQRDQRERARLNAQPVRKGASWCHNAVHGEYIAVGA